jgi:hypothetical protein
MEMGTYGQINRELYRLTADYIREHDNPVLLRPHWIALDLADEHGEQRMDRLRTTQTLKTSIELCLEQMGYRSEGTPGNKVWRKQEQRPVYAGFAGIPA